MHEIKSSKNFTPKSKKTFSNNLAQKIFWLNCLVLVAITINLRAPIVSLGPIIEEIKSIYGINSTLGGLLTSLPLIAFGSVSFLVAYFSPIRALVLGLMLIVFGEILRGFGGVFELFLGMGLIGCGVAIANVLLPSFVKEKFPQKVPKMMGIYSLFLNLSSISGILLALPLLHFFGLRFSLLFWLPFSVLAFVLYLPHTRNGRIFRKPKIMPKSRNLWTHKSAIKITAFMGTQSFIAYAMFAWFALIVSEKGFGNAFGANMLLLSQVVAVPVGFFAPLFLGRLRTRYRPLYMSVLCGLYVVGFALLLGFDSMVSVVVASICIGIPMGGVFAIALLFISTKSANAQIAAKLSSMAQGCGYLLASTSPFILGALHDYFEGFREGICLLLCMGFVVSILGFLANKSATIE